MRLNKHFYCDDLIQTKKSHVMKQLMVNFSNNSTNLIDIDRNLPFAFDTHLCFLFKKKYICLGLLKGFISPPLTSNNSGNNRTEIFVKFTLWTNER